MKKIKLILSLLIISSIVSFAKAGNISTQEYPAFQTGFYGGFRIGSSCLSSNSETFYQIIPLPAEQSFHRSKINNWFASRGLHLGYLCRLPNCLILAPEIFLNYNPSFINIQEEGEPYINKIKTNFSLGANLRIGTLLTDCFLLYGFMGMATSPFKFEVYDLVSNSQITNQRTNGNAFTYGMGIEYELENTHRLRFEIACANYRRLKFSAISNDKLSYHSANLKPKVYSVSLMYSIPL